MQSAKFLGAAALSVALILGAVSGVSAQDDEEECGGIITALKKYGDDILKVDAKTPVAICAAMGKAVATSRAIREVADQCMEEGEKRDKLMKDMEDTEKAMQGEIDKDCK